MSQKEKNQQTSHSHDSGRSSSKKQKSKKTPQRGLGVAQLEKMRLEEQQKRDSVLPSSPVSSLPSLPVSTDLCLKNPNLRPTPPVQNFDLSSISSASVLMNHKEPSSTDFAQGSASHFGAKPWRFYDYNTDKECLRPNPFLPCESNLNLPDLNLQTQPLKNYSVVNLSAANSSPPLTLPNFQMELPSNQSYTSSLPLTWPHEDKIKRFEEPAASGSTRGMSRFDAEKLKSLESPSCSLQVSEPNLKRNKKTNGSCIGDFLTLGPPSGSPFTSLKAKDVPAVIPSHCDHELKCLETRTDQIGTDDQGMWPEVSRLTQLPYYSFLSPSLPQSGQGVDSQSKDGEGKEEIIDLTLKL